MSFHLDFEKPILELEGKIAELRHMSSDNGSLNISDEISRMQAKTDKLLRQIYGHLSPEQKVQVARHPARPHFSSYLKNLFTDVTPLAGDRHFAEDHALYGGLARFNGQSCVVMGQEKGNDTESRIRHNFGMTRPEGYRKAVRLMQMAHQFKLPVITFVDTSGAYPGVGAEERGQAEAIAKSIETCFRIEVPIVSVIIGEGGSGGAIAIAAADRILMLEHAVYSVISPEGCASILWRSAGKAAEAAAALRLTAQDLKALNLIDQIIEEPLGGAHREPAKTLESVDKAIKDSLSEISSLEGGVLLSRRHHKFLEMGQKALR